MVQAYMWNIAQQTYFTVDLTDFLFSFFFFAELQDAVEEVLPTLREQGISVYILSESCNIQGIDSLSNKISQASDQPLSRDLRANVNIRSTALYIYTSGTTGTSRNSETDTQSKIYTSNYANTHSVQLQDLDDLL